MIFPTLLRTLLTFVAAWGRWQRWWWWGGGGGRIHSPLRGIRPRRCFSASFAIRSWPLSILFYIRHHNAQTRFRSLMNFAQLCTPGTCLDKGDWKSPKALLPDTLKTLRGHHLLHYCIELIFRLLASFLSWGEPTFVLCDARLITFPLCRYSDFVFGKIFASQKFPDLRPSKIIRLQKRGETKN